MVAVKVLTGDFRKTPLAEVLNVLHTDKETATLVCRNNDKKRALFLWRGQICDAESNIRGETLIDALRSMGKLEDEQYRKIQDHEGGNKSPAQLLVELGFLPVREVIAFIRVQIVGVLNALFEESEGLFKLILGEIPERGFSVRIPVPELLIAGVKHIPTYEKVADYLGKLDRKAQVVSGKTIDKGWHLGPEDEAVIQSLKGRPTYQSVLDKHPNERREVAALLYALEILGYLTGADGKKPVAHSTDLRRARAEVRKEEEKTQDLLMLPKPETEQARLPKPGALADEKPRSTEIVPVTADFELYAALDRMTLYQVLQLEPKATEADVKAAYFRLAKIYHPDRFFGQGPERTEQIRVIFEAQSRAYNTLKDPASRRDYDRSLESKRQGKVQQTDAPRESDEAVRGRVNYQQALQAIEVKNYQAAVDALHRATDANPQDARYWGTLAEVQSRFARWKSEALAAIERALELQPDNVEFLYLHGVLLSKQPDYDGAARVLRRAMTIDRSNLRVRELLEEVEAKGGGKKGGRGKPQDKGGIFNRIFGKGEES